MKLDSEHILAALALIAAGYMLAQRKAAAAGGAATAHNGIGGASDWWTYAGSWA